MHILKAKTFNSKILDRTVRYDLVLPPNYTIEKQYPVLLMNDGQDYDKMDISHLLLKAWASNVKEFIFVGIHANKNRLSEYGTSQELDYLGRGKNALSYQLFVLNELLPLLGKVYNIRKEENVACGFSLGGLSAIDMTLENVHVFDRVGVFSGAFWWRSKPYGPYYNEATDRIIHQKFKKTVLKPTLSFWFQCGTDDEKADRNNNGIIDAIDDTLDLISILKEKGYKDVNYKEIKGGQHNHATWKKAFPDFLTWAFA
jgi:enterochelin esterase-like enzyme